MNRPASSVRVVAFALVLLTIGLAVGFEIGTRVSSVNVQSLTTTVYATTTIPIEGSADLVGYCFSPGGDCADVVVDWINRANGSIHVLMYSFTLDQVSNALVAAKNRGVDVKIVMERDNAYASGAEYQNLKNAGVDIRLDNNPADMHDKVAIIDGHILLSGSLNWSARANTANNENLIVIDSSTWGSAFEAQFQNIYDEAGP